MNGRQPSRLTERLDRSVLLKRLSDRTDGRTDERTQSPIQNVTISPLSDAHARVQDLPSDVMTLADVLAAGVLPTGERFPVTRTGERAPIPWHIRSAVWYRDRGTCQFCKWEKPKPWHLDHIHPWSSGGSDRTENLRLLCEPCNMKRSNYDDRNPTLKRPVTWWCHRCYSPKRDWRYRNGITCTFRHYCRVVALYGRQIANGEAPTWHERGPVEDAPLVAYCAHCNVVGMTDVTL